MIPKPLFGKVKAYVLKLRKEYEAETVGKTGLAAVPVEIGRLVCSFITDLYVPGQPRISKEEAEECCEYLAKQGLLVRHPWGGFMAPPVKGAPEIPPKEKAKEMVLDAYAEAADELRALRP